MNLLELRQKMHFRKRVAAPMKFYDTCVMCPLKGRRVDIRIKYLCAILRYQMLKKQKPLVLFFAFIYIQDSLRYLYAIRLTFRFSERSPRKFPSSSTF